MHTWHNSELHVNLLCWCYQSLTENALIWPYINSKYTYNLKNTLTNQNIIIVLKTHSTQSFPSNFLFLDLVPTINELQEHMNSGNVAVPLKCAVKTGIMFSIFIISALRRALFNTDAPAVSGCIFQLFPFFLPPASLTSSKTQVSGHPADFWLPTKSGSHDNRLMLTLNWTWEFSSRRGRYSVSGVCAFLSCCGRCVRDCVCLCCVHVCAAVLLTFYCVSMEA